MIVINTIVRSDSMHTMNCNYPGVGQRFVT